ncbi:hypothetical protein NMG60_11003076, partial [Bertholletia excelsa]
ALRMRNHCRKELEISETLKQFDYYIFHASTGSSSLINHNPALLLKAIANLSPQAKQTLLDCLRKQKFQFHASLIEGDSWTWFGKCFESLFGCSNVPRRKLESDQFMAISPAPAPGLGHIASSPANSPPPPFLDQDSSPSPRPPSKPSVPPSPKTLEFSPTKSQNHLPRSASHHPPPPEKSDDHLKYIIVASVASSSGASPNVGNSSDKNSTSSGNNANKTSINSDSPSPARGQSSGIIEDAAASAGGGKEALPLPPGREAPPPAPLPPPPPPNPPAPRPPPPPKAGARPPPVPQKPGPHHRGRSSSGGSLDQSGDPDSHKTKLKPFFWDKVLASPDHSMVWHELKAGSFQVNEEMMESLFGYNTSGSTKKDRGKVSSSSESIPQYIQIIDPKKSQNLAIILKALNVTTEEVCDALNEGNELPSDLVYTMLKMAPTQDEELKLRLYNGDLSLLAPVERFLKVMIDIPFAYKRLESLLFIGSFQEEVSSTKESFQTLEVACTELRKSRLFLKLLEAVLKLGNRMNDGTYRGGAQAFKLDTLLKLSDVKGTDGKTTLLHFVVQEIIKSEGIKAARAAKRSQSFSSTKADDLSDIPTQETPEYYCKLGLRVVSRLGDDLENVRKAASIEGENLTATVSNLDTSLVKAKEFLNNELQSSDKDSEFKRTLAKFVELAETEIAWLVEEEKRILALVKSTGDYFHGNSAKDEGLRLFVIVRDFLRILDKACKEVESSMAKPLTPHRKESSSVPPASENSRKENSPAPSISETPRPSTSETPGEETSSVPSASENPRQHNNLDDIRARLFPVIMDRRMDDSSSDDDGFSP